MLLEVIVDRVRQAGQVDLVELVVGARQADVVVPVRVLAQGAVHAQGDGVRRALVLLHGVFPAAHVFRGEGALQVQEIVQFRIVEVAPLHAGAPPGVVGTDVVLDLFVAEQHVGVALREVIEVPGRVGVELHAVLAVLERAVARGRHRTAVVLVAEARAGLQVDRTVEAAADVGAVGRVEELVAGERAVDQPVAAGQLRGTVVAVGIELAGEVALVTPHRVALLGLDAEHDVQLVVGRADAVGEADAAAAAAALIVATQAGAEDRAVDVLLEDDVDHAGDRVGAVQRGLATRQDLDPLHQLHRNAADVVEDVRAVVQRRVVGHRAAIDQVLHVAGGQAEQAERLGALGERGRALVVLHAAGRERAALQHFGDVVESARLDVFRRDDRDRGEGLHRGLRDQRTGHRDLVEVLRGLVARRAVLVLRRLRMDMRGRQEQSCSKGQCQWAAVDESALVNSHSGFLQKCEQIQVLAVFRCSGRLNVTPN